MKFPRATHLVILCPEQRQAEQAREKTQAWTEKAGLVLHPSKTRLVDLGQQGAYIDFLGYRLKRHTGKNGKSRILRLVKPKSLKKIKESIRRCTPRKMEHSLQSTITNLNRVLRGWFGYFRSSIENVHHDMDGFVRRRLRSQLCKANGKSSWGVGIAHRIWPNNYFVDLGLFSLEAAHLDYLHSHRETTNGRAVCGKSACTVRREG